MAAGTIDSVDGRGQCRTLDTLVFLRDEKLVFAPLGTPNASITVEVKPSEKTHETDGVAGGIGDDDG